MSGDEMERHLSLSLGEPEQLRRNMTPASEAALYVGDGTPGSFDDGDEQMEPPPDDMFPQLESAARPPSVQAWLWSGVRAHASLLKMLPLHVAGLTAKTLSRRAWQPGRQCRFMETV